MRKIILLNLALILTLLLKPIIIFGQDPTPMVDAWQNVIPPSPTAASLAKFAEYPVSLYTGTQNVDIPLWEVKTKELSLPISLFYHASGVKVSEVPGWAGLGWTFNAGGVITRSVIGLPDDIPNIGYIDYCKTLNGFDWDPDFNNLRQIARGQKDGQPDMFYYNIGGQSGKFIFGYNELTGEVNAYTIPFQKIDIQVDDNFQQWILTVEDGTKYVFGLATLDVREPVIERTFSDNTCTEGDAYQNIKSSWYLVEIISPSETDHIKLYYESSNELMDETVSYNSYHTIGGRGICKNQPEQACVVSGIIYGHKISRIESSSTIVEINREECRIEMFGSGSVIKEMTIKDKLNDSLVKKYQFHTDYFGPRETNNHLELRLKLDGISEFGADLFRQKPPYRFVYNEDYLPPRNSNAKDHWGYYNGADINTTLVPEMIYNCRPLDGADRETHEDFLYAGILKEVHYPTGGYARFEYEPHDYGFEHHKTINDPVKIEEKFTFSSAYRVGEPKPYKDTIFSLEVGQCVTIRANGSNPNPHDPLSVTVSIEGVGSIILGEDNYMELSAGDHLISVDYEGDEIAFIEIDYAVYTGEYLSSRKSGGLRLKKSIYHDGFDTSKDVIKEYEYVDNENRSTGVLVTPVPSYTYAKWDIPSGHSSDPSECQYLIRSSNGNFALGSTQGSHIGYKKVIQKNGVDGKHGKTIYTYSDPYEYLDLYYDIFPFPPTMSKEWQRGLLKEKIIYDSEGYKLLHETNSYTFNTGENKNGAEIKGIKVGIMFETTLPDLASLSWKEYIYTAGWKYKHLSTKTEYFDKESDSFSTQTEYRYDNPKHAQLTSKITTRNDRRYDVVKYKYPYDFYFDACESEYNNCTSYQRIIYDLCPYPKSECYTAGNSCMTDYISCEELKLAGSQDEYLHTIFAMQKEHFINSPIESQQWIVEGDKSDSTLVNANLILYKEYPQGFIKPKKMLRINPEGKVNNFVSSKIDANDNFIFDSKYEDFVFFDRYDALGNLLEVHKANDNPTSYIYGYKNLYPVAKIENAGYPDLDTNKISIINNSSINSYISDKIDELKTTLSSDVFITSYLYKPLVGVVAETDVNNNKTTYDYDTHGRLVKIADKDSFILKKYVYDYRPVEFYINVLKNGEGEISPSESVYIKDGESKTFEFTPAYGYEVKEIKENGISKGAASSYTVSRNLLTEFTTKTNIELEVDFGLKIYQLNTTSEGNGSISPSGTFDVLHSQTEEFSFSPSPGYHVEYIIVNGDTLESATIYNTGSVESDMDIHVKFRQNYIKGHIYQLDGATGYSGQTINLYTKEYNQEQGHYNELYSGTITDNEGFYQLNLPIGYDHSELYFEIVNTDYNFTGTPDFTYYGQERNLTAQVITYEFNASAGTNGSISPPGLSSAEKGSVVNYTITPNDGYYVAQVLVGGETISASTSLQVTANESKTIHADFAKTIKGIVSYEEAGQGGVLVEAYEEIEREGLPNLIIPLGETTSNADGSFELAGMPVNTEFNIEITNGSWVCSPSKVNNRIISISTVEEPNTDLLTIITHPEHVTITASINGGGSISHVGDKPVDYNTDITYHINPLNGHHIADVKVNGASQGVITSYTFTNVKEDQSIEAIFEQDVISGTILNGSTKLANVSITLYRLFNDPEQGMIEDVLGTTTTDSQGNYSISIAYSGSEIIRIRPTKSGYSFSPLERSTSSTHAAGLDFNCTWTITASAGSGGSISSAGVTTLTPGSNKTYTVSPNTGYDIKRVLVNGSSIGAVSSYTFSNVNSGHTIAAEFSIKQYTITASKTGSGTMSPSGNSVVNYNGSKTYTFSPSTGYYIYRVLVNGSSVGAVSSYTFSNVKSDKSISVEFRIKTFTVSATSGSGGSISPSGTGTVNYGSSKSYSFNPNTGYEIKNVKVNGTSVGSPNNYTINNITENKTIYVEFSKIIYNISISYGDGVDVTPVTNSVEYGESITYNFTTQPGYIIGNVKIDGVSKGIRTSWTFSNVTSNHSIEIESSRTGGGGGPGGVQ